MTKQATKDITRVEPSVVLQYAPRTYTQLARDAAAAAEELHEKNHELERVVAELKIANEVLHLTNERLRTEHDDWTVAHMAELSLVRSERDGYQRRYLNMRGRLRAAGQVVADTLIEDEELNAPSPLTAELTDATAYDMASIVSEIRPQEQPAA